MCNKAILKNGETLGSVPNSYKTQEIVKELLIILFMHYNLFPIDIRLKK